MASDESIQGKYRSVWPWIYVGLAIFSGIGAVGKAPLLHQILHVPFALLFAVLLVGICVPLAWKIALRLRVVASILFAMGILVASLVVYPRMSGLHGMTRGSDQAACVIAGATKLSALQWPYNVDFMWSHHPMSCGPGWIMLQLTPIVAAGYGVNLLLIWAVSFYFIAKAIGSREALATAALLAICPGVWMCAVDGSDFLTFGIALAAMIAIAGKIGRFRPFYIAVAALLFQFRVTTLVMPGFLRKTLGLFPALLISIIGILFQLAFLIRNPADYVASGPLHVIRKASFELGHPLLFEGRSVVLAAVVTTAVIVGLAITLWVGKFIAPAFSCLCFLGVFVGFPAVLDLLAKFRESGVTIMALGFWEGGTWLVSCLPLLTLLVVANDVLIPLRVPAKEAIVAA